MSDLFGEFRDLDGLLAAALEHPSGERSAFLESVCADHPELASGLRQLVQAGDERTDAVGIGAFDWLGIDGERNEKDDMGEATMAPSPGRLFGERYLIQEPLGQGGMAQVFRAQDTKLKRAVALKVVYEDARWPMQFERLEREALTASGLNHPNLVTVHDVGREADCAWIAMELVDGKALPTPCANGACPLRKPCGWRLRLLTG